MIDPLARLPRTRGIVFFFQKFLNIVIILDSWDVSFLSMWSLVRIAMEEGKKKKERIKSSSIRNFEIFR